MGRTAPVLSLIGHGTAGNDGIEPGVHLRWQFRREVGFPVKCFTMYRRPVSQRGAPVLVQLPTGQEREFRESFKLGSEDRPLKVTSSAWPLLVKPLDGGRGRSGASGTYALFAPSTVPSAFTFAFPQCAYHVKVEVVARGAVTMSAFARDIRVAESRIVLTPRQTRGWLEVEASAIDRVVVQGQAFAVVRLLYHPCERHEDHASGHWEPIAGPICLPVCCDKTYPGPGLECKEQNREPECESLNVERRLPNDACAQEKYGGERAKDLVSILRTLVCGDTRVPQASVLVEGETESEDCLGEGQPAAEIALPAIDALLLASVDPVVARILGLYFVDASAEPQHGFSCRTIRNSVRRYFVDSNVEPQWEAFDYKVVGDWPEGTLWLLKETLAFDDLPPLRRFLLNFFPFGELVFRAAIRPRVITSPATWAGTRHALAFEKTDSTDWNLPQLENSPFERWVPGAGERMVDIRFAKPVGEVQVFIGQRETNVVLEAWDDDRNVQVASVRSSRTEEVLAAHGKSETDQITRIVLRGARFWIYKVCWQNERIAHGEHAAFVYGLRRQAAVPLAKPQDVKAFPLPGLVRKVADCEPPLQGASKDARYSVGLTWQLPISQGWLPARSAVRYHVRRVEPDGRRVLLTSEQTVCPEPVDAYASMVSAGRKPEGWPADYSLFIDAGLGPERYRYEVAGIDLFGRISEFAASPDVEPSPPPPPPPTGLTAVFIDSRDRWLAADDCNSMPEGQCEAIRLTWQWTDAFDRGAPDVESFRIYFGAGKPNMLLGAIAEAPEAFGERLVRVSTKWECESSFRANVLAGRMLLQGSAAFRILTHDEAAAGGKLTMVLRLPPAPSVNQPVLGPCSLGLDASIPADVLSLSRDGDGLTADIKTSALGAMPSAGLVGSTLTFRRVACRVDQASLQSAGTAHAKLTVHLRPLTEVGVLPPQDPAPPFAARLDLPPIVQFARDYSASSAWPVSLGTVPKVGSGRFKCMIRKPEQGESPGVVSLTPREFVILIDDLPGPLNGADLTEPRSEGFLGVSCTGPAGESPVAGPARAVRVFRGDDAQQAQVAKDARPRDEEIVVRGPPRFDGTVTCEFSWKKTPGWRYEVYRALDETVFAVDRSVREALRAGTLEGRFPSDEAKNTWIEENFGPEWRNDITSLVIAPPILDLTAIEAQGEKAGTLLQALASLPHNEVAFSRLDQSVVRQPVSNAAPLRCVDESLPGRAKAKYFYRIRLLDIAGNAATMAISTPPVCLLGEPQHPAPAITGILGGDRQIFISWSSKGDRSVKGYVVYRTSDPAKTADVKLMMPLRAEDATYSVEVRGEGPRDYSFADDKDIEPGRPYYYRLQSAYRDGSSSGPSEVFVGTAYDESAPPPPEWLAATNTPEGSKALSWASELPDLKCSVERRLSEAVDVPTEWRSISGWLARGEYRYVDGSRTSGVTYVYRLRVLDSAGRQNRRFNHCEF